MRFNSPDIPPLYYVMVRNPNGVTQVMQSFYTAHIAGNTAKHLPRLVLTMTTATKVKGRDELYKATAKDKIYRLPQVNDTHPYLVYFKHAKAQ